MGSGEEKELGQEERLGRPGREKKEKGLGWARLLGFGLGSLPFSSGLRWVWVRVRFSIFLPLFYFYFKQSLNSN